MTGKLGLTINTSPHIHSQQHGRQIMLDVVLALSPSLVAACGLISMRALLLAATSTGACVLFECLFCKLTRRRNTIEDCSAVVTGLILAFSFRATTPLWMAVCGAFIAIVLVKNLFGGLGNNVMNPALTACYLTLQINKYIVSPLASPILSAVDVLSAATPLTQLKAGLMPDASLFHMLLEKTGGSMGEVSSLLLLLGGAYLVWRDVIKLRIPLAYCGTVALLTLLFPRGHAPFLFMLYHLLGGSVLFGALYVATDYASSPVTAGGQWLYGIGCGVATVLLRYYGPSAEGVTYAILLMNLFARPLDRLGAPRRFGTGPKKRAARK